MDKGKLINELKQISKKLFDEKQFYKAGKINVAIDLLEEILPQTVESKPKISDREPPYNCPNGDKDCKSYPSCGCEFKL